MTLLIILITVIASLIAFSNAEIMRKWIFNPYLVHKNKEWWRFFTSGLIHADFLHLGLNMFVLYSFGQAVEYYFDDIFNDMGAYYYVLLYLGGLIISSAPTYNKQKQNYLYNSLGASGAVSAILFAAIMLNPWNKVYIMGFFALPGIIFGPLYLFLEYRMSAKGGDNINHDAHFWGAVFGFLFPIMLKPKLALEFFDVLIHGMR
ncbi:MAG: rhomboid family intramembrane serine protease [Bacteroidota bacterium]